MKTPQKVTIWITRDKGCDGLWIHTKKPELCEDGQWISENRTCYIVPKNLRPGQKKRIVLEMEDV